MDKDSQLPKTLKQVFCNYFEIDDDIIAEIDKICSLVKLKKNKNIINQGDVCRDIIIVRTGMMRPPPLSEVRRHSAIRILWRRICSDTFFLRLQTSLVFIDSRYRCGSLGNQIRRLDSS